MKLRYIFAKGKATEVEITDENLAREIAKMNRDTLNHNTKETRRHRSMDELGDEYDLCLEDPNSYVEEHFFRNMDNRRLYNAIAKLNTDQQDLLRSVFFNGKTFQEIADELGLAKQTVHGRYETVLRKLKKFLQNP